MRKNNKISDEEIKTLLYKEQLDKIENLCVPLSETKIDETKKEQVRQMVYSFRQAKAKPHRLTGFRPQYIAVLCACFLAILLTLIPQNTFADITNKSKLLICQLADYTRYMFSNEQQISENSLSLNKKNIHSQSIDLIVNYIPNGYKLSISDFGHIQSYCSYETSDKKTIYIAKHKAPLKIDISTQTSFTTTLFINGRTIIVSKMKEVYTFIWEEDNYVYLLHCSEDLQTCKKIIQEIK